MNLTLNVNGQDHVLDLPVGTTLLQLLREHLGLTGAKEGCVEGECGACTVLVDGQPLDSCISLAHASDGCRVTTVEGLAATGAPLSALQQAFLDCGGVQCGFCTPGLLVTLSAYLDGSPEPTDDGVARAIAGNICRCTGYAQVIDAVLQAATTREGALA